MNQEYKRLLSCLLLTFVAVSTPASSAPKLSDKDACKMATAYLNQEIATSISSPFFIAKEVKMGGCSNFESRSDQGTATIIVSVTYKYKSADAAHQGWYPGQSTCSFSRFDQGWKVSSCGGFV